MYTFIVCLICLLLGYIIYGRIVERIIGPDDTKVAPCYALQDGIDYTPMPTWKVFLIQFLNIAGTGPIFGTIQGILFGPAAYIWIVLGCVFGGAVHDYMSGMISLRKNGASLPEIIGDELGSTARIAMRVLAIVLMILVGAAFTTAPAGLLANLCHDNEVFSNQMLWLFIILAYYFGATLLPINKLIGRIYPIFGLALLIMAIALFWGIFTEPGAMPEITEAFTDHSPVHSLPLLPGLCITISCGAVSGFHATQSPMMARCLNNERHGRPVFYGAMITEGIIALVWAAAVIKFADAIDMSKITLAPDFNIDTTTPYGRLWALMTNGGNTGANPAIVVNAVCSSWLGVVGAVLVILGVVAAPITTGDTAFRSARLITADFMHIKQEKISRRIMVCLPIFAVSLVLMFVKFDILWRYLFWINQNLSIFTFLAIAVWLARHKKNDLIALIPAIWMTWVCITYILVAREGFGLSTTISNIIGAIAALSVGAIYLVKRKSLRRQNIKE